MQSLILAVIAICIAIAAADPPPVKPTDSAKRNGIGNFVSKIKPGAELTVGYFGASVTNGAGASSEATKWRSLVHHWLETEYPETRFRHVHVVNGGTGSHLGASRLAREHLAHDPDLLFVEFSVNDGGLPYEEAVKAMEGIIRQIIRHDPTTDIIILHTLNTGQLKEYEKGALPRTPMAFDTVAEHYGVPTINVAWVAAQKLIAGEFTWEEFSIDSVHPRDLGYQVYADHIIACMKEWRQGASSNPRTPPEPLREDNWEDAGMVHPGECVLSDGWRKEEESLSRRFPHFPDMMTADQPGESIKFRFRGTHLGFYHVVGPDAGTVEIIIDGESKGKQALWDQWCRGHRSAFRMIARDLPPGEHDVEIRILDEKHENSNGHALHLGFITMKGQLVK